MERIKNKLYRYWIYFRRAWQTYFLLPINFLNFITIQYKLLIQPSFLHKLFPSFITFMMVCGLVIGGACVVIGYYDFTRGSFREEVRVSSINNPYFWDQYNTIKRIEAKINRILNENDYNRSN